MTKIKFILIVLCTFSLSLRAQQNTLGAQVQAMTQEKDPYKSVVLLNKIIADNKLDSVKDAETIDILKGNVAVAFLRKKQFAEFKKYVNAMKNKFNQTSYLSMSASTLINEKIDNQAAERFAKEALDLYFSFKDDPKARPADMPVEDWNRFMDFAKYPYNDTYAQALYANGKYKEALIYQERAFRDSPEEGITQSVERYAQLLALNGKPDQAYQLLENLIKTGKSTAAMDSQFKELYARKKGSATGFDSYYGELQKNVQATIKESLKTKMLDTSAPTFSLLDLKGKKVSLADLRGKVVVVDFWATWCMPCIASFPAMQKMVQKHPEVVFLFIATQEKPAGALDRVKAFVEKNKYPFTVLMDELLPSKSNFEVVSAYNVKGIPSKAIIDKNGKLRFMSTGFSSDSELINELEAMISLAKE
jgi:thiol-disulfide isomerase/thioredoxin